MGASRSKPEVPTTSDSQCRYNILTGNCTADKGYLNSTCTPYALRCYTTNAAAQCSADSECSTSWTGECVNRAGAGSLYCRHTGPYGACECYVPTYNVRVWPTRSTTNAYNFPERCNGVVTNNLAVGYAYSGGGSRSFAAMIGYMRFMSKISAQNNAQYVSTVSGGSWFHAAFSFASAKFSQDTLLGFSRTPQNISLKTLDNDNFTPNDATNMFLGARVTDADVVKYMTLGLAPGSDVGFSELWQYVVGKILLEPYGLNDNVPIAMNAAHAQDIESRNRGLGPALVPVQNSPFWICNGSVIFDSLDAKGIVPPLVMTALYSGVPNVLDNQPIGGVWTETFALGAPSPGGGVVVPLTVASPMQCPNFTTLLLQNSRNNVPSLKTLISVSSAGYTNYLFNNSKSTILESLNPSFNFWSPSYPGVTVKSDVTDGQYYDNSGVVQLLARGVRKVVSFVNSDNVLDDPAADCPCPSDVSQLFGSSNKCGATSGAYDTIQVFKKSEFQPFFDKLRASKALGGPTFARAQLEVLPNFAYGVEGGFTVDLLVILLQPSPEFNALLAPEVVAEMAPGMSLERFPNYKTIFHNLAVFELTRRQVNLLSSYTEWCITHFDVQAELADLYGVPKTRYMCTDTFQCEMALVGAYDSNADCAKECKSGYTCQLFNGSPACLVTRGGSLTKAACESTCK
jgi:hypothetical protein